MTGEQLACRGCRHPLTSDAGCALCLPVKVHLVVVSAVDEDAVPLAVVATEAITILRKQLKQAKSMVDAASVHDPLLAAEVRNITNAIAKLMDSSRKVIQDGADAVESMSFQEKASLFLEWTATLPGPYRRRLVEALAAQGAKTPEEQPANGPATVN